MSEIDYRPQQSNILYWRNVANEGRGSQMTQCLHEACDYAAKLESENAELRASLKECVEYAERYEDSGPFGEGWQSERLVKACQRARALLAKVEGE